MRGQEGRYCHLNENGEPVYVDRYRYAGDFRDGIAVVQRDDGLHSHIDLTGRLTHGRWFVDLDVFHKGFARGRDKQGWHHIEGSGKAIYQRRFAAIEPFYNGQARVECFDGSIEVINEMGDTVIELRPPQRTPLHQLSSEMVGFWRTQTIRVAVELGVFNVLPATTDELAQTIKLLPSLAKRLLRGLWELGLVSPKYNNTDNQWFLTNTGKNSKS